MGATIATARGTASERIKDGNMRGIRSARAQQCLRTASMRLVDEEVRGLVRRAIHVVDAVLLQRPRKPVDQTVFLW